MAFFGAMGGGLLSGMFSAISGIVGAIGQAEAAEAQAEVARMNAEIQRRNAAMRAEHGREQAFFQDRKNRAAMGQQLSEMSASGVKTSSPSFLRARTSLAKVAGEEAYHITKAADIESWNYKAQAAVYEAQANAYEAAASNALLGGFIGAFSSLIGSAQQYAGPQVNLSQRKWYAPRYS